MTAARIPPGIKGVNVVQENAPVEGVPEPGGLPAASSAAQGREAVRISEFTSPDEPRFSCLVTPTPNGDWWWSVFSGDGSVPGSLVRGSSETSLARALEAAAEWARHYPEEDERV